MILSMNLTSTDLQAIKRLFDSSIEERVPGIIDARIEASVPAIIDARITARLATDMPVLLKKHMPKIIRQEVQPRLDKLEKRLKDRIEGVRLDVGMYSHELTDKLSDLSLQSSELSEKLEIIGDMTDSNKVAVRKINRKLGMV